MKNSEIKYFLDLYKQGNWKVISESMMEVESHNVMEQTKKGRKLILCDCENNSTFANLNLCRHSRFFILFPFLEKFFTKLEILEDEYKAGESLSKTDKEKELCSQIWNDLKSLEGLK